MSAGEARPMPSEYEDKLAVEVRHRGPCPYPKGHTSGDVVSAIILTAMATFLVMTIIFSISDEARDLRKQAVAMGCAAYDQKDGHWHWLQGR